MMNASNDVQIGMTRQPYDFIAAVGLAGTGKSTFVEQLVAVTNWSSVYFGGVVLDEIKARGLAVTPTNERQVREDIRDEHGPAAMAILGMRGIDLGQSERPPTIIDGLYSYAELIYLREQLGDRLLVVAIHSSFEMRVTRLGSRPNRPLTPEQIKERDRSEVENIGKAPPIALADKHFVNDGEMAQLTAFAQRIACLGMGNC